MNPAFAAYLAVLGVETVIKLIKAYKTAGEPTEEQIRTLEIKEDPGDLLRRG